MSNTVKAPALIHCNCTTAITGNKADEANFEIYRYLDVDEDGDRNVFCGDQPFLFSDDCKPYINIKKNFNCCKSKYYGEAVKSLITNLENLKMRRINEGASNSEILYMGEELTTLSFALTSYNDKVTLKEENKSYPCLLQVVDRWFSTAEKARVNNHFSVSNTAKKDIEILDVYFWKIAKSAKENTRSINDWNKVGDGLTEARNKMKSFAVYNTFSFARIPFKAFNIMWKYSDREDWFDERMKELKVVLEKCKDLLYEEIFFATNQIVSNSCMKDIYEMILVFFDAMEKLPYVDEYNYKDTLISLKIQLRYFSETKEVFEEKEFLQDNSFLVCRLGGIISIVYDGEQLRQYTDKIYPNIVALLKYIEEDLHDRIFTLNKMQPGTSEYELFKLVLKETMGKDFNDFEPPKYVIEGTGDYVSSMFDGYNFVRNLLIELREKSQYEDFYVPFYEGERLPVFGTNLIIRIRPRSEINKKAHTKEGWITLFEFGFDKLMAAYGTGGKAVVLVKNGVKWVLKPDVENTATEFQAGADFIGEVTQNAVVKSIADVSGALLDFSSLAKAIGLFSYYSTADYVGEIQIIVQVGTHDILYSGIYDLFGNQTNKVEPVDIRNQRDRTYHDAVGVYYTEKVDYTKQYENKISLDYSLKTGDKKSKGTIEDADIQEWVENELEQIKSEAVN